MWEEKISEKKLDEVFDSATQKVLISELKEADAVHLIDDTSFNPYLTGFEVRKVFKYNPNYGDHKECACGHPYHRHFDSYENDAPVGCKYCPCNEFKEKQE